MRKPRFSLDQIHNILEEVKNGCEISEICKKYRICVATYYNWRSRYGDVDAVNLDRIEELEKENRHYKKMYKEEQLKSKFITELFEKKYQSPLVEENLQSGL